jgi:hypothetical protein
VLRALAVWLFTMFGFFKDCPCTGKSGSANCPDYPKGGHADTLNRANWHFFGYPDWGFSVLFPQL